MLPRARRSNITMRFTILLATVAVALAKKKILKFQTEDIDFDYSEDYVPIEDPVEYGDNSLLVTHYNIETYVEDLLAQR